MTHMISNRTTDFQDLLIEEQVGRTVEWFGPSRGNVSENGEPRQLQLREGTRYRVLTNAASLSRWRYMSLDGPRFRQSVPLPRGAIITYLETVRPRSATATEHWFYYWPSVGPIFAGTFSPCVESPGISQSDLEPVQAAHQSVNPI